MRESQVMPDRVVTGEPGAVASPVSLPVLYPDAYAWFVLASALDLMLTWAVLWLGGSEVNPLAAAVLGSSGFAGMIVFKFSIVALVVAICEVVGRSRWTTGRRLSIAAVVISASPILWSMMLIARHLHG